MTTVYYTYFHDRISERSFENILSILPISIKEKVKKFRRWQDAHASLLGKLLLMEGFKRFGISTSLEDLRFTAYGKPCLRNVSVGFNISHSGNYVVCVLSEETDTIGIDIEEVKDIKIDDFQNIWTPSEWGEISQGEIKKFYQYWTKKEAVIKADGRGLSIPLKNIDVSKKQVLFNEAIYYTEHLDINKRYMVHLASKCKFSVVKIAYLPLDSLSAVKV